MKNNKGITYIALILIVILIVSIGVASFFYIKDSFTEEKLETVRTNMLRTQAKLQILKENSIVNKDETILKGQKVTENRENEKVKEMLEKRIISEEEENFDSYYIIDENNLSEMGLSGIYFKNGNFYIVNYKTLEVIWTQGIVVENVMYYKLSELRNLKEEKSKENLLQENNEETPQGSQENEQKAE